MKKIVSFILVLAMALSLAACSSSAAAEANPIEGKWKFAGIMNTDTDTTYKLSEIDKMVEDVLKATAKAQGTDLKGLLADYGYESIEEALETINETTSFVSQFEDIYSVARLSFIANGSMASAYPDTSSEEYRIYIDEEKNKEAKLKVSDIPMEEDTGSWYEIATAIEGIERKYEADGQTMYFKKGDTKKLIVDMGSSRLLSDVRISMALVFEKE